MHIKVYEDISISEGLSSTEMINFSGIDKHPDVVESMPKKKKKKIQMKQNMFNLRIH